MPGLDAFGELRALVRQRHVHFEVRPELVVRGDVRLKVGFEARVWSVHDRGAHALPGCSRCDMLHAELERIVQWAMPEGGRPTRLEVERTRRSLYDSREVPGSDEVAVVVRLVHRDGYEAPIDACEERCLRELRERLRWLGIPER